MNFIQNRFRIAGSILSLVFLFVISVAYTGQAQVACPTGFVCTPATQVANCPAGFVCTPTNTSNSGGSSNYNAQTGTFTNGYYFGGSGYTAPTTSYTAPTSVYNTSSSNPSTPNNNAAMPGTIPGTVSSTLPAVTSCPRFSVAFGVGSTGQDVSNLQTFLIARGFDIRNVAMGWVPKGYFGTQTAYALAQYQTSVGIPATGVMDAATLAKINAAPCVATQTTPPTTTMIDTGGVVYTAPAVQVTYPTQGLVFSAGGMVQVAFTNPILGRTYTVKLSGKAYEQDIGTAYVSYNTDQYKASYTIPSSFPSDANPVTIKIYFNGVMVAASESFTITGGTVYNQTNPTVVPEATAVISYTDTNFVANGGTLNVYGNNFNPNPYVLVNGLVKIKPTSYTNNSLVVTFPTTLAGGYQKVQVGHDGGSAPLSGPVYITFGAPIIIPATTTTQIIDTGGVVYTTPISATLSVNGKCFAPGSPIVATVTVSGSNITSKTLQKDTNSDGVYGEIASWGTGPGTHTYTSNESATYTGTYSLKVFVNGVERTRQDVIVSASCAPTSTQGNATPTVSASPTTIKSGSTVTLSFGRPANTTAAKLYISCPVGVSIPLANNTSMCNTYQDMNASQSFAFKVNNTSNETKTIIPNFYVYTTTSPTSAVGVSTQVIVTP